MKEDKEKYPHPCGTCHKHVPTESGPSASTLTFGWFPGSHYFGTAAHVIHSRMCAACNRKLCQKIEKLSKHQ